MTRRHFIALAAALAETRPYSARVPLGTGATLAAWRATRDAIATACYASNGRFDRERFNAATEK